MHDHELVCKFIENKIKEYIDENIYLFKTDAPYILQCHLKPRLIANAIQEGSSICRKKGLFEDCNEECFKEIFIVGLNFATEYLNSKKI